MTGSRGVTIKTQLTPPPPSSTSNVNFDDNIASVMGSMGPMLTNMTTAMMDAQLKYYKQPGKITEIAKLNKQYFENCSLILIRSFSNIAVDSMYHII